MKWHLYKRDDPNSWPKIDCKFIVYDSNQNILVCSWNNDRKMFFTPMCWCEKDEYYYAYIAYVPSEYQVHELTKCADDSNCKIGCCDDGYCMYDFCDCEQQRKINEYTIKEKRIWKEFE